MKTAYIGSAEKIRVLVVAGPTATGKTALGVWLARRFGGEVVSADSRQVYIGMDIGTGKDLSEFELGGESVRYHLIDIADPAIDDYNLMRFAVDAPAAVKAIVVRGARPIVVGGSTMYLDALISGYELTVGEPDPERRGQLDSMSAAALAEELRLKHPADYAALTNKSSRPRLIRSIEKAESPGGEVLRLKDEFEFLTLGVYYPREEVRRRVEERLDARLAAGMVDEVRRLRDSGVSWERLDRFGLEYRYMVRHLRDGVPLETARDELLVRIHKFVKRQDTWYRRMERNGLDIHWLDGGDRKKAAELAEVFFAGEPLPEPEFRLSDINYGPPDPNL